MKPLLSKTEDQDSLQTLGRASVQIVHDLKNQLNGLKLYATFLRRRMEKSERPADELETVAKLLAGLERAAGDLSTLVQFGRPIEVKRQPGVDLQKLVRGVVASLADHPRATGPLTGPLNAQFELEMTPDALKSISIGALKIRQLKDKEAKLQIRVGQNGSQEVAVIEWLGLDALDHDPFAAFAGSDEIRMSLGAKIISAHGGAAAHQANRLLVQLPIDKAAGNGGN
jgi:light-regulated signal transduction histidine kinase (bacteriophytochrome)